MHWINDVTKITRPKSSFMQSCQCYKECFLIEMLFLVAIPRTSLPTSPPVMLSRKH